MRCRRGRSKRIGSRALAGMVALASVLALSAADTSAGRNGKPDLVLKSADQRGKPYGFYGARHDVTVKYAVRNRGGRDARGDIYSKLYFVRGGQRIEGERDLIPARIKPGKSVKGTLRQEATDQPLPSGAYKLEMCVDFFEVVEESNEENNCEIIRGSRFYSTYRDWEGHLSGSAPFPGGAQRTWSSRPGQRVSYGFQGYRGKGVFDWSLKDGAILHSTAGGSPCSYAGSGTFALANGGKLTIDHKAGSYSAVASAAAGAMYNVVVDCSGFKTNLPMPVGLIPALAVQNQGLPFGATSLQGVSGDAATSWEWKLDGK